MSDMTIRQDILDELEFEPSIDANDIGVAVESGIVTLTGYVSTYPQKLAVERAVMRIKGVKGMAQEIQVRHHPGSGLHDDEIARRAVDMLKWSTLVPEDKVQVKVQHGWVTLTGTLEWAYQRQGAIDVVYGIRGVTGVTDHIELRARVAAADVKTAIDAALRRNAEMEGHSIRITVAGNKIVMDGVVRTWRDRQVAEDAVWATPGVTQVEDRLAVS